MVRKDFTEALDSFIEKEQKKPLKRSTKSKKKEAIKSSKIGTKKDETRATFIVKEELLQKIKALSYWERTTIKEVLNSALDAYIKAKEKERGETIKPIPNK